MTKKLQLKSLDPVEGYELVLMLLASTTDDRVALRAWKALRASNPTGDLFPVDLRLYGSDAAGYYYRLQVLAGMTANMSTNAIATALQKNWRSIDQQIKAWAAKSPAERARALAERKVLIDKGHLKELPLLELRNQRAYLERDHGEG